MGMIILMTVSEDKEGRLDYSMQVEDPTMPFD